MRADFVRARAKLRGLLLLLAPDGRCARCRKKRPLTVDHVDGQTWGRGHTGRHRLNWRDRVNRYVKEYRSGVRLRALCGPCNSRDGNHRRWRAVRAARAVAA